MRQYSFLQGKGEKNINSDKKEVIQDHVKSDQREVGQSYSQIIL